MLKKTLALARCRAYDLKRKAGYPLRDKPSAELRKNYFGPAVTIMQVTSVPLFLGFATVEFWIRVVENVLVGD